MPFLVFAAIALIGAAIHRHRDSQPRSTARTLEIFLIWWMVVAVGIAAIFGSMFHFGHRPRNRLHQRRRRLPDRGWLRRPRDRRPRSPLRPLPRRLPARSCDAVSICYLGDAYGHLHQAAIHDNHAPDNTGLTLWADFISPLVAIALYALWRRTASSEVAKASA